jgi:hypothetical protein
MNVDPAKDVRSAGPRTGPRAQVTGPEKFGVSREELPAGGMMIMQSQNATLCVDERGDNRTTTRHGSLGCDLRESHGRSPPQGPVDLVAGGRQGRRLTRRSSR